MGKGKLTEHAQKLMGCEKCNLRRAVDSSLSLAESDVSHADSSQAGSSQASLEDSTLSPAESVLSQAGSS